MYHDDCDRDQDPVTSSNVSQVSSITFTRDQDTHKRAGSRTIVCSKP